jgi:hypothetical protein
MDDRPVVHGPHADDHRTSSDRPVGRSSRWQKTVGILGLVVLLIVGAQMVAAATGTGGGFDHGPGIDAPPAPPTGGGNPHDPSRRGH